MKLFAGFIAAALAVVPSGCGSEHGAKNPDSGSGKLPAARAVAEPDAKLDLTTPQAAVISHFEALAAGDAAAAKRAAIVDDSISDCIDASIAAKRARCMFVEAVAQRFGKEAAKPFSARRQR